MIKGIERLNEEQRELLFKVNKLHKENVGLDYKEGIEIIEAWIDEDNVICARLKNGEWYHYLSNLTYY